MKYQTLFSGKKNKKILPICRLLNAQRVEGVKRPVENLPLMSLQQMSRG